MQMTFHMTDAEAGRILEQAKRGYVSLGERYRYEVVPRYVGRLARAVLVGYYGLPNACPTAEEWEKDSVLSTFYTKRSLFVDDTKDGEPICVWEAEEV